MKLQTKRQLRAARLHAVNGAHFKPQDFRGAWRDAEVAAGGERAVEEGGGAGCGDVVERVGREGQVVHGHSDVKGYGGVEARGGRPGVAGEASVGGHRVHVETRDGPYFLGAYAIGDCGMGV